MGKLPGKIVFSMILYGAGFITAIYLLVPSSVNAADQAQASETVNQLQDTQTATGIAAVGSQDWAVTVRTGIDTCIEFAEEYALQAADLIRSKMGQGTLQSD